MNTAPALLPVVLFGAGRGTGLALARLLRARDVPVIAMLRGEHGRSELGGIGVTVHIGDAMNPANLAATLALAPSGYRIVSTLGGSGIDADGRSVDEHGNQALIDAALAHPPARFVLVTSLGCGEMLPYRSAAAINAFGDIVEAKTRAEEHLRASGLPFSIIRPGGLRDGPPTGRAVLTADPEIHGFIQRTDLATLTERVLRDPATLGTVLAAVDQDHCHGPHPLSPFALAD